MDKRVVLEIKGLVPPRICSGVPDYYIQASEVDRRLIGNDLKGKKILNVGVGYYLISDIYFARLGAKVVGIDYDKESLIRAKDKLKGLEDLDIELKYGDGRKMDFPDNSFDIAISFSSIEHMPSYNDRLLTIKEMKRVTKKNGLICVTGPNLLNLPTSLFSYFLWKSKGKYEHRYTPWELRKMLTENGLEIVKYDAESVYLVEKALIKNRLPWIKWMFPSFTFYPLHLILKFLNGKPFKIFGMRMGFAARKV